MQLLCVLKIHSGADPEDDADQRNTCEKRRDRDKKITVLVKRESYRECSMQRGKKAWIIHLEAITFNDDTFMIMALSVESEAV